MYEYIGKVVNVVDGDTIDIEIDLGFNIQCKTRIRLLGIDTPEIYGVLKQSEEYKRGLKSKFFVESKILNQKVLIKTKKDKTGKYGRYLASVYYSFPDFNKDLGTELLEANLAIKYEA